MKFHLIHIGYPKAGSTFLQEWFRQHPQLFYAPGGLGGFYNIYEVSNQASKNNDADYKYFVTSDESLSTPRFSTGTIPVENGIKNPASLKPAKSAQKKACEILKTLYPNGKILFITRGFKEIIVSGYSQYVRTGGIFSFKELTGKSHLQKEDQTDKNDDGLDYNFIADLYEKAFGKENIITLPFELLREDQAKFLSIIEERLGLAHFEAHIGKINESLSPEELYWYPQISSVVSKIAQKFGYRGYAKIYRWYVSKTLYNKFSGIIKLLSLLKPKGLVKKTDFPPELLDYYRERAELYAGKFRYDPIYKPYLADYLLDEKYNKNTL